MVAAAGAEPAPADPAAVGAFLEGEARTAFRAGLPLGSGTWARGRGWALWKALILATGLALARPDDVARAEAVLSVVLADPMV